MTIMLTDPDVETAHSPLRATDRPEALAIVEFCSMMTRRLGLLAGTAPADLPEPVPFKLPRFLAG